MNESEFNEELHQEKKMEKNRNEALEFYFKYSVWANPYHLEMYGTSITLTFYDSDSEEKVEIADFRDKNFNKDFQAIREICDDYISRSR